MNDIVRKYNLRPADRIIVPKSDFQIVQHHAIYLGQDKYDNHLIIENKIGFGVRVVSIDDFFKNVSEITDIKKFKGSNYERKIAIERALKDYGQPYDLISFNCEHFSHKVQHNVVKSFQLDRVFTVLIFILLFFVGWIFLDYSFNSKS